MGNKERYQCQKCKELSLWGNVYYTKRIYIRIGSRIKAIGYICTEEQHVTLFENAKDLLKE